ncbi:MAG TPA: MiaB/RimO family radical SAM methylthiotransferase [Acidobacteriaceae bacterium]|nr:MiaB/RimO family radical SAM methylthiotransferase [Acidobacteriaceae bacterium]
MIRLGNVAEYHVENFGCRASQADGEILGAQLRHRGLLQASNLGEADVIVANTCSVTAQADRTARAFIRRAHRENPGARILVTGCYAQRAPREVAALPGVHAVIGNSHKALVPALAQSSQDFVPLASLYVDDAFAHSELSMPEEAHRGEDRGAQTRPNLKVQDGCGNRCSFCIIPQTRGHSRSTPWETCLREVQAFVAAGGTEMVLSGINLGSWGRDFQPARTLDMLVSAILERTGLPRLRLSSVEPMDWNSELLALFSGPQSHRLARHAHLPLQSGSDAILRTMHRRYRPWHYAQKLQLIHSVIPDAAIGADVMVGFPGETDALFEENFRFITAQPFTYLHLFPFSPRPGTRAWQLARELPVIPQVVAERMARLREWIAARNLHFRQGFLGRILPAVTLRTSSGSLTRALSDNFIELYLDAQMSANQNVSVLVTGLIEGGLTGRLAA